MANSLGEWDDSSFKSVNSEILLRLPSKELKEKE